MTEIRAVALDHLVVNVSDVERAVTFYCEVLGLVPVRLEEWRRGEAPFPSARVSDDTLIDILCHPRTGDNVDHFCLVIEALDFEALCQSGGLDVVDGPATRFGARGEGISLYVRDPDGNVVELRYYS